MPSTTKNLGISRELALAISIAGILIAMTGLGAGIIINGLHEGVLTVISPLMIGLGAVLLNAVTSLKSTESADTASKAKNVAELTASQAAAAIQILESNCGEICPLSSCPFKSNITQRAPGRISRGET